MPLETMETMAGQRRRICVATCLICALRPPHIAGVGAFSPMQHIGQIRNRHDAKVADSTMRQPPVMTNAFSTLATAAALMGGIVASSPLPSIAAADASPSDITTAILRRQMTAKLSETEAFQNLRRDPPTTRALRELSELQELQDARLDACADRGALWEQCFMFGDSASDGGGGGGTKAKKGSGNLQNGLDYQYLSPIGVLESGDSGSQQQPNRPKTKIPTW